MTGLDARKIGEQFLVVLEQWLTPSEFADCCSHANDLTLAHDFCDANMAMDAAFRHVMGRGPVMPSDAEEEGASQAQSDADMVLFDSAWDEARDLLLVGRCDDAERSNGPAR
jgi:hypothetical protein